MIQLLLLLSLLTHALALAAEETWLAQCVRFCDENRRPGFCTGICTTDCMVFQCVETCEKTWFTWDRAKRNRDCWRWCEDHCDPLGCLDGSARNPKPKKRYTCYA